MTQTYAIRIFPDNLTNNMDYLSKSFHKALNDKHHGGGFPRRRKTPEFYASSLHKKEGALGGSILARYRANKYTDFNADAHGLDSYIVKVSSEHMADFTEKLNDVSALLSDPRFEVKKLQADQEARYRLTPDALSIQPLYA